MSFFAKLLNPVILDQVHNIFIAVCAIATYEGANAKSPILTGVAGLFTVLGSVSSAFNVFRAKAPKRGQ